MNVFSEAVLLLEAAPGPHDARRLFDRFLGLVDPEGKDSDGA